MPLWCQVRQCWGFGLVSGRFDEGEYFAGDVTFQAADDVSFAFALLGASFEVFLGGCLPSKAGEDDAVERGVGLPVAELLEGLALAAGMVTTRSKMQVIVHPAIVEAHLGRTAAAQILARLVSAKTGAKTPSQRGADAARARWSSS